MPAMSASPRSLISNLFYCEKSSFTYTSSQVLQLDLLSGISRKGIKLIDPKLVAK